MPEVIAGRYRLTEPIGRDGGAEVWRGVDRRLDAPVAIKIVTSRAGEAAGERFTRQARAAAQLMHPNVVKVLDVGQDGDRRFLVMELLPGRTVATEPARGPLGIAEACALFGQAADGLAAAHRAGVVHGALDAADLHLAGYGVLKIAGFAHARPVPEAAPAADVFALGRVAYEALCGRPPFPGADPHRPAGPVTPPRRHRPELPAELDRLLTAMLAEDPAARPTAEAVRRTLGELAARLAPPRPPARPAVPPAPSATSAPTPSAVPSPAPSAVPPPAARAGDTALLDRPLPEDEPPRAARRLLPPVAAAVGVIAAVTVAAVLLADPGGRQAAAPPTPPAATAPATEPAETPEPDPVTTIAPAPEASPSPQPTALNPERDGWEVWLSMLDRAVLQQELSGGIRPDLARKAHDKIRKAAGKYLDGEPEKMRKELRKLQEDLRKARWRGELAEGPLLDFLSGSGVPILDD